VHNLPDGPARPQPGSACPLRLHPGARMLYMGPRSRAVRRLLDAGEAHLRNLAAGEFPPPSVFPYRSETMRRVLDEAVREFISSEHLRNLLAGEWVPLHDEEGQELVGIRGRIVPAVRQGERFGERGGGVNHPVGRVAHHIPPVDRAGPSAGGRLPVSFHRPVGRHRRLQGQGVVSGA
jgi:hypothetical protein